MDYRGIFWDFGGVVTTSPFEAFNRYEHSRDLPPDFIRSVNATNPDNNAWARLERSEINLQEFDSAFAKESSALGHCIQGRDVIELLSGELRPRVVDALEKLREHYYLACLTNNVKSGTGPGMAQDAERARRIEEVMALFEFVQESSLVGVRKPDPRFYTMACEQAGLEPGQVVYLDDLGINLKPARNLGMHTIKVVDGDVAMDELSELLGVTL